MSNLHDYETVSTIGTGTYGTCYKIRKKSTGQYFVWKTINYGSLSSDQKKLLVTEVNLLSQLNHPNIVRYYDRVIDKSSSTLYIIMEWCEKGDLATLIAKCKKRNLILEESFIWRVLYQTSCALHACHSRFFKGPILHRDIKPANIFLDRSNNVKLGDFGLARILCSDSSCAQTFVGTPYYMSPEIVSGAPYDRKTDIWALGCLIYELCALCPPFTGVNIKQLVKRISAGRYGTVPPVYSDDLREIISTMLTVNRNLRPSIETIMYHPSLVSNVVKDVMISEMCSVDYGKCNSTKENTIGTSIVSSNISVVERETKSHKNIIYDHKSTANEIDCTDLSKMQNILLHRFDTLKLKESSLRAKELLLCERERELERRERDLNLLDKLTKEKLVRANVYLRHCRDTKQISENSNHSHTARRSCIVESDSSFSADAGDTSILPTSVQLKPQQIQKPFSQIGIEKKVHFEERARFPDPMLQNIENKLPVELVNMGAQKPLGTIYDHVLYGSQKCKNDTFEIFTRKPHITETVEQSRTIRDNAYNHSLSITAENYVQENKENSNIFQQETWIGPERGNLSSSQQICNHKNYGSIDVEFWKGRQKNSTDQHNKKGEPVKLSSVTKKIASVAGFR